MDGNRERIQVVRVRYAARRDTNEPEIVEAARRIGLKVFYTSELGDLIVQYGILTELWEVKTDTGKLTEAQVRRKQQGLQAVVVRNISDVVERRQKMIETLIKISRDL